MKTILLVFMAFQFDAGATHEKVAFDSPQACEVARATLLAEYAKEGDGWGRKRMLAVCLPDTTHPERK